METYSTSFDINGSFGLYQYDDIDHAETKESILNAFKQKYEKQLIKTLDKIGMKYKNLSYYSPKYYNYEGDNLDLTLIIKDKKKFKRYILKYQDKINARLVLNKSYDGYTALTCGDTSEEIENLNSANYSPDVLVLMTILNQMIDFKGFNPVEYFVYSDDGEI